MYARSQAYSRKLGNPKLDSNEKSGKKEKYESYIVDGWKRCRNYGLNPYSKIEPRKLTDRELNAILEKNYFFIKNSLTYMENIYSLLKGTGFVISLVDEYGTFLEVLGDEDLINSISKKIEIAKGVILDERKVGNTSVTTSLISEIPIMFRGNE